ncbi:TonB-dependent receptor [Microbulbifer agarilyticus]|uniref:TonB-dependent receptor n=1 Tax=Microbulbifer agarilyticus TaxID=260552 RepID=UPI001C9480AB|nr:TonB-dependent receptor [Microbulbifer agarilyticus]MBY6190466.1 TonB-dependent receptor [Microbulbifer agarilyticus]
MNKNLLSLAITAAIAVPALPAIAQQDTEQDQKIDSELVEEVVVTGSRIKKPDLVTTRPITSVDSEYLKERGITNAQQAVADIPGVFAAANPIIASNTAANSQGVGQRTVSLFDLGSQRTLTLVNGGRFVSSNSPFGGAGNPGSQVDVNNIPVSLIDRVEVVKVGGSAVYGADAVAGVVNYVLKKDYEGAELSIDNRSIGGDLGNDTSIRGLFGGNFDNGRGNLAVAVEYNKMDNILSRDVDSLSTDDWGSFTPAPGDEVADANGDVFGGQVRLYKAPRAGILSFSGLITPGPVAVTNVGLGSWSDGNFYQFDPSGSGAITNYDPGAPTGNSVWASGGDGLDLGATNTAQEGYERWNIVALGSYQLTDSINFSSQIFSNASSAANPGYQALQYNSGVFGGLGYALEFDTSNPFLTDASRQQLEDLLGGPGTFYMQKGWTNLGAREITNESETTSFRFGLDGDFTFLGQDWSWDVAAQKGWSTITSSTIGLDDAKFVAALDAGINPNTGEIDCRYNYEAGYADDLTPQGSGLVSDDNPLGGVGSCAPLNPFGEVSPEAYDYITYSNIGQSRIDQEIFSAYLSGDAMQLPAGALGVAMGVEYRTEAAGFTDDGTSSLQGLSDASLKGEYDTLDGYAEAYVPIISDDMGLLGLYSLSMEGSYRVMENSRSGEDDSWAVGINYRPIADVMIRGNIQETVRAPAVEELFLPQVESAQFATDPCDERNLASGPNPEIRQANCASEGIPTDFSSIAQNASRRGFNGGNLNLQTENAESTNIGIVYTPSWFEGFAISADYIEIDIADAIVSFELTDLMNACYDASDFPNSFCNTFVRGSNFQLPTNNAFTSGYVNAALRSLRAMQYNATYESNINDMPFIGNLMGEIDAGYFSADLSLYNLKKNETSNTGFDFNDTTGQHDNPDWRGRLTMRHQLGRLTTLVDLDYAARGERNVFQADPLQYIDQSGNPFDELPSRTLVNLGANYELTEQTTVRLFVENATGWEPTPAETAVGRWTWGTSYTLGFNTAF